MNKISLKKYGFNPTIIPDISTGTPGRITAVHRGLFEFVCDAGVGYAHLKSGEYYMGEETFPTTGDFVMLDWQEKGESRILQTLKRKTFFSRLDPSSSGHEEQVIAANFDYVFILQSLDQNFSQRSLERYLTLAWQSGAVPVVLLTKSDKMEDFSSHLRLAEKMAIGVGVFAVSATTGYGTLQLADYLKPGKTIVFLGPSGVGKSCLVNALAGEEVMTTGSVRDKDSRGRHTTTRRQLILLKSGVMVIDTPGMRELGMWDVSSGLGKSFADVESYLGQCKFSNCSHQNEPGCEVKAAIRRGELSNDHWESYLRLESEARFIDDKSGYLKRKEQFFKSVAEYHRQGTTADYRNRACVESFTCQVCGAPAAPKDAGSKHRNHCPLCLSSLHLDNTPGDRASLCKGIMDPISVWARKNGEWAIIHRCRSCGTLSSNRIAADDSQTMLMSIAMKPINTPPFPFCPTDGHFDINSTKE